MAITSYTELKTAVEDFGKRTDLASHIDTFIDLAEAAMWHGPALTGPELPGAEPLRIRDMEARATASPTTRYLALPTGYIQMRKLRLYTGNTSKELTFRVPESITVLDGSGLPTEYTVTSQIEFNKTPSGYTAEMQYYKTLSALSASNTSNGVLTRFPSVYLFGCLYFMGLFSDDTKFVNQYGSLFVNAIKSANKSDRKGRYGAAKSMKIEGSTP